MRKRAVRIAVIGLVALMLVPALAHADADPASDVLLGESVFYPYTPRVSVPVEQALDAEVAAAAKRHFPIKVALIASPVDLGAIPALYGKPQQYADFLDQEISFTGKQILLVVMPAGFGVQGVPAAATRAAASLGKPSGATTDALAKAATAAVARLAAVSGHPIAGVAAPSSAASGGGSSPLVPLVIVVLVAVAAAAAVIAVRRRATR